jgi:hypothetical protein
MPCRLQLLLVSFWASSLLLYFPVLSNACFLGMNLMASLYFASSGSAVSALTPALTQAPNVR